MLPLLRVLPIGTLLLSALIFMLAATPPRELVLHAVGPARGPLIDAAEHPEWRQFYLQAAFKRAGELEHLRDLPNAPTRMPPIAALPEPQNATMKPAPTNDVVVAVAPPARAPTKGDEPVSVPPPGPAAAAMPPAPPALVENERVPLSSAPPQQIAGLPTERESADAEDVTGALDSPAVVATMPIEIGETSSTELSVVVLPQRPPRLPMPRPKAGARAKASAPHARPSKPKRPAPAAKQKVPPAAESNSYQSTFGAH